MSATPEQIADELEDVARISKFCVSPEGGRIPTYPLTQAAALIRAQAERVKVLEAKLEKIAGEAPAKEPRDEPSVAWPPSWSTDYRDYVSDMIREAFADGRNRGAWEAGQIADAALKAAP